MDRRTTRGWGWSFRSCYRGEDHLKGLETIVSLIVREDTRKVRWKNEQYIDSIILLITDTINVFYYYYRIVSQFIWHSIVMTRLVKRPLGTTDCNLIYKKLVIRGDGRIEEIVWHSGTFPLWYRISENRGVTGRHRRYILYERFIYLFIIPWVLGSLRTEDQEVGLWLDTLRYFSKISPLILELVKSNSVSLIDPPRPG